MLAGGTCLRSSFAAGVINPHVCTHTNARAHTRAHTHTHTHKHTAVMNANLLQVQIKRPCVIGRVSDEGHGNLPALGRVLARELISNAVFPI